MFQEKAQRDVSTISLITIPADLRRELKLESDGRAFAQGGLGIFTPTSNTDIQNPAVGVNWHPNNSAKLQFQQHWGDL